MTGDRRKGPPGGFVGTAYLRQSAGNTVSLRDCEPQQATELSRFTPQVWSEPALTETNSPDGGLAWPTVLSSALVAVFASLDPQHSTEPSRLTPQVWKSPALTEANSPVGGVA